MKKSIIIGLIAVCLLMTACTAASPVGIINERNASTNGTNRTEDPQMKNITMAEAKEIFQTPGNYIILDVRRADEFAAGHIPGAINVANESILSDPPAELPDMDRLIYVYCRSGNRSKQAAAKLVAMGYTHIVEFGGFLDWTGEVEK